MADEYARARRIHVKSLKQLRDLGLSKDNATVTFHRDNLSLIRHWYYSE